MPLITIPQRRLTFNPGGVELNGTDWFERDGELDKLVDGDKGICSVWFRIAPSATGTQYIYSSASAFNYVRIDLAGNKDLTLVLRDSADAVRVNTQTTIQPRSEVWHHALMSWNGDIDKSWWTMSILGLRIKLRVFSTISQKNWMGG